MLHGIWDCFSNVKREVKNIWTVSELVVKILEAEGITDAFGIPGASINGVYQYWRKQHQALYPPPWGSLCPCGGGLLQGKWKNRCGALYFRAGSNQLCHRYFTLQYWFDPLNCHYGQAVRSQMGKDAFQLHRYGGDMLKRLPRPHILHHGPGRRVSYLPGSV